MIEILPSPDHVAAFQLEGTLTAEDYDRMIPQIEEKLGDYEHIGILADMTELEDLTADAVRKDLQYGIGKLGEFNRFERAGVISDKQWVEAVMELTDTFFPGIEARVFAEDEKEEAMRWVSAIDKIPAKV